MKKENPKVVHRFTQNALMKFRPLHCHPQASGSAPKASFTNTVSNILGGFFRGRAAGSKKGNPQNNLSLANLSDAEKTLNKNKSTILQRNNSSYISNQDNERSLIQNRSVSHINSGSQQAQAEQAANSLFFLQKINADTFLIGNQHQLDLISISGIFQNLIDTDLHWNFSPKKPIKKLAIDTRKLFLALQVTEEILVYKYETKRIKSPPVFVNKVKILGDIKFLIFLKDNVFGAFSNAHLMVYQIEQSNAIRLIFNKKYGVSQSMELMQIPKPIENILNIFFKERSLKAQIHTLWRLQFDLKNIGPSQNFKSLARIYDIPNRLLNELKINNYSKDTFIMNFKYQILAAKDGYIIDSANINIEDQESCLIHSGEHLLLVSDVKLELYKFKIATHVKPNKIVVNSVDSIQFKKDKSYVFMNCIQMLNGNFVLFYQVKPHLNRKTKGQIDYMFTVTQKLSIAEKLNQIFSFKSPQQLRIIAETAYEEIEHKCDIAFKIGLSRKEIYLQLWNKSGKSTVDDYKFLLDTLDYETIKQEIEKKLKKSSMQFRQVYKLEQCCFEMLKQQVFGNKCTEQYFKNYIKSHFLLRKLQFYRDIQILTRGHYEQEDDRKCLTIDIQQYSSCINSQLTSYFLEHAFKICFEEKPQKAKQLRLFIKAFRFPLRIIYSNMLEKLIIQSKHKLIIFLKTVPEILPYEYTDLPEGEDAYLYKGLTAPIAPQQWHKNLHLDQITTIYNKEAIAQVTKTVWFKRNQYSLHDLIPMKQGKIQEIQKFNASDSIFYFFIEKIFQHCPKDQEEVVSFLESNYDQLPSHLKGCIFLYRDLYDYFVAEKWHTPAIASFNNFLKLQDFQLFRQLFKYQKVKKGCLLKDAKQIYAKLPGGNEIYNQSLLRYFTSDLSQISDLKCILNRLNNQKRQFHMQNEGIYEVLVKGMQTKLKLGSDNDIPLEQVMIYVENIPLTKNNPIIEELKTIQKINQEAERFKSININLSFLEIMEKEQFVISALLDEQIRKKEVMKIRDEQQFIGATYQILAEIQIVKQKIYKDQFRDLQYFLYLNKLLQNKQMIRFAKEVLEDPHLSAEYVVDQIIVQNLILYMYKWRLQEQNYIDHQDYVLQLMTILPEDNSIRKYIQAETEFAVMLSSPGNPVQYPLAISDEQSNSLATVKLSQIQHLFEKLSAEFIVDLDLEKLHNLVKQMELFYEEEIIKLEDIYQIAIKRLIELKDVKKAIPYIRTLIKLRENEENYSIVFCYLILNIIIVHIPSESHKKDFVKIAFHTFNHPLELLDIIQQRLNSTLSNDEQEHFLKTELKRVQCHKCYNPDSILLDQDIVSKVKQKEERYNPLFQELIFRSLDQVTSSREDFGKFQYTCIYIFLLHNPYAFAKYVTVRSNNLNLRIVRSYLSYIFKEQLFNGLNVLRFGKRVFIIALENLFTQLTVQYITSQYKGIGLEEEEQVQLDEHPQSPLESKLIKSIKAFSKKIDTIKSKVPPPEKAKLKKERIEDLLSHQGSAQVELSEYPFTDSDDNYESAQEEEFEQSKSKRFIARKEKKPLREQKNLALFLSSCGQQGNDMRKTSPKLKNSLNFHNQFQSVHFSKRAVGKERKRSIDHQVLRTDFGIMRTESLGNEDEEDGQMEFSKSQGEKEPKKDTMQEDMMYISMEERKMNPSLRPVPNVNWSAKNNYVPVKSEGARSISGDISEANTPVGSPKKLSKRDSEVNVQMQQQSLHGQPNMQITQSLQIPYEIKFTVNIQEINDEDYTPVQQLVKSLLQDIDPSDSQYAFNLSLIDAEQQKQFGNFETYLKKLVLQIYESSAKPLSVLLELIKAISGHYPELGIRPQFLKIYIALQSYNTKYKYNLPIRQMFPIQAVFSESSDIKVLFQEVKEQILSYVDFDKLMVVAKVIHFSFQKSQIKDQLYFSYLCKAIEQYGNDTASSQEELGMEKQRIGGIIDQIILVNIFIQRAQKLLSTVSIPERLEEICQLIREALKKKKKANLIGQFDKAVRSLS